MLLMLSCFCCCCCCFGGGYWLPDTYCTCCQAKVSLPLPQRPLKPQTSVCLCISRCLIATRSFIKSESATRINLLPQFTPDWYLFGSYHLWKACTACCCLFAAAWQTHLSRAGQALGGRVAHMNLICNCTRCSIWSPLDWISLDYNLSAFSVTFNQTQGLCGTRHLRSGV